MPGFNAAVMRRRFHALDRPFAMVDTIWQTTDSLPAHQRWEFWRHTALAKARCEPLGERMGFAARRTVAEVAGTAVISTKSAPLRRRRTSSDVARYGGDMACVTLFTSGRGAVEQAGREAALSPEGLLIYDVSRLHVATVPRPYTELRLHIPRATFAARVGRIEALAGFVFPADEPLAALLISYLKGYVAALPGMANQDAEVGMDGLLHLLSGLAGSALDRKGDDGAALARDGLLALADRAIASRLADPGFDVVGLTRALGVSRSRLYTAFADRGGVAAAIRDARLDRARLRLADPTAGRRTLDDVALACGFTDYPSFTRAFRRRFGLSPRDARAG